MRSVFIYGGCTSRDAVDFYPEYGLELHSYIARQSLISGYHAADPALFNTKVVTGNFQRRMLRGDAAGSLPEHLVENASEIDLVIWDLMVERLGVRAVRGGGMATRNASLKRIIDPSLLAETYAFGTDQHFNLWRAALDQFVDTLERVDLREKIVVNATPWAVQTISGEPMQSSSGMTPTWFNENIERYWKEVGVTGIKIARVSPGDAIADPDHKWGPAYFHYAASTYRAELEAITSLF